jgi:predicted Ser/Thr protein kinase
MSSYALTNRQVDELANQVANRAQYIAELIAKGVAANAQHNRVANVSLAVKIKRNDYDPRLIEIEVQEKIKSPKSKFSDLTSWDEPATIIVYKTSEIEGQLTIEDAVG